MTKYYRKNPLLLIKKNFKKTLGKMLKDIEVNENCSKSIQKYTDLVKNTEALYSGYIQYKNVVTYEEKLIYKAEPTAENIKRLIGYKDEYIG